MPLKMGMGMSSSLHLPRRRTCDETCVTAEVPAIVHAPEVRFARDFLAAGLWKQQTGAAAIVAGANTP